MQKTVDIKQASNYLETADILRSVDLLLLDLKMPGNDGLMGLIKLRSRFPAVGIVVVSATEGPSIVASTQSAGAMGYIPKSSMQDIQSTMNVIEKFQFSVQQLTEEDQRQADTASRIASLTPQQLRVLAMIAKGDLNKQIAYELNIKETTIKTHISEIFKKLQIQNRTQAALITQQFNLE